MRLVTLQPISILPYISKDFMGKFHDFFRNSGNIAHFPRYACDNSFEKSLLMCCRAETYHEALCSLMSMDFDVFHVPVIIESDQFIRVDRIRYYNCLATHDPASAVSLSASRDCAEHLCLYFVPDSELKKAVLVATPLLASWRNRLCDIRFDMFIKLKDKWNEIEPGLETFNDIFNWFEGFYQKFECLAKSATRTEREFGVFFDRYMPFFMSMFISVPLMYEILFMFDMRKVYQTDLISIISTENVRMSFMRATLLMGLKLTVEKWLRSVSPDNPATCRAWENFNDYFSRIEIPHEMMKYLSENGLPLCSTPCPCGSGKAFSDCHKDIFDAF